MTVDVAARLAAGRPSAGNTQAYVSACHATGYQHPDLTAYGAQILEWYGSEDGLDLHALEADCGALRAAAAAADEAMRLVRDGATAASAAWQGESGSFAVEFVERHCAAGAVVTGVLRAAAQACEVLRDGAGRVVDEKVGAAMSIDDRRAGERPVWLAAAATVTSGGAAREDAVEVVTQQITPYVDAEIRTEWLTAMRSATSSVAAAYDDAVRRLAAVPPVHFEVPGPLGAPSASPSPSPPESMPAAASVAVPTVPAASVDPAPPLASPPDAVAAQAPPPAPLADPSAGLGGAAPGGVPAMPDAAGGLSGLVGQLADALGGLFDGMDTPVDDGLPELDDSVADDVDEADDDVEPAAEEAVPEEVPVSEEALVDEPQPVEESPVTDGTPAPPPPESPTEPLAAEQPAEPEEQTPCEIAADELAQVGQ